MKKISLGIFIAFIVLAVSGVASAMLIPVADQAKDKTKADNSPVIERIEIDGVNHLVLTSPGLEKIVYIHHKKNFAKPPWAGEKGKKEAKCYGFLGKGVSWDDLSVSYVIDPSGSNLAEDFVASAISAGAEEWDTYTGAELFNNEYGIVYNGSWDINTPDGRNELVFGDYPDPDVIAVAVVWGYFSGPPSSRKIIEFDVLFDTDFTWGNATVDPGVMDLQNIATHEIGHGAGLDDVYDNACSEVTMYGYSGYGEIEKRTLEQPDIKGIQELYGSLL